VFDINEPDFENSPGLTECSSFKYCAETALAPVISIVVSANSDFQQLKPLLNCILGQSIQSWECLIYVPQSSTSTNDIIEATKLDPRIQIISSALDSPHSALEKCRTNNFIHFTADMRMELATLEKYFWCLESHPEAQAVSARRVLYGADNKLFDCANNQELSLSTSIPDAVLIRKSALEMRSATVLLKEIPEFLIWQNQLGDQNILTASAVTPGQQFFKSAQPPAVLQQLPSPAFQQSFDNSLAKEKKRFLLLAPWLTLGGVDKFNLDLSKQLVSNNWEVTVTSLVEHGCQMWMPKFADVTPDVFRLHSFLRAEDHLRFLVYLINSRKIDVAMVTLTEFGYLLLPYLRNQCPNTVFVDYCHALPTDWINFPGYAVLSQQFLDLNIVSSRALKDWMVQNCAEAERIEVAYTNIDTNLWKRNPEARASIRKKYEIADECITILYACRLTQQKQPKVFAKSLKNLADRGLKFHAFVAGHGELSVWLEEFVKDNNLTQQITFLGPVPNEQLRDLMSASDIYYLPSIYEGISLAVYEAMAMELTTLSADVGGQRELVSPDCGILLPHENEASDVQRYTEILAKLVSQPLACRELGACSRRRVEKMFQLSQMGERMISLFERATILKLTAPRPAISTEAAINLGTHALQYSLIAKQIDLHGEQSVTLRHEIDEYANEIRALDARREQAYSELAMLTTTFDNNTESINFLMRQQHEIFGNFVKMREALEQAQKA